MLVYSTFVHLFALAILMFLPNPRIQEQIVVPTFRLDLIELPFESKSASTSGNKQKVVAPPVKKRIATKAKPITKKLERQKIKTPVSKPESKPLPPLKSEIKRAIVPVQPLAQVKKRVATKAETIAKKLERRKIKTPVSKPESKPLPPLKSEIKRAIVPVPVVRQPLVQVKKRVATKAEPIAKKLERQKIKTPVSKPESKPLPPPIPVLEESEARKKILSDLNALESGASKKTILEELDQVARLEPKIRVKKVVPPKPMLEETFKEMENKKSQELPLEPEQSDVPPLIGDFEVDAIERELAKLAEQPLKLDSKKENKTTSDLLKELEAVEKVRALSVDTPEKEALSQTSITEPIVKKSKSDSLKPLLDKFEALEDFSQEIKIDISQDRIANRDFKSGIQSVKPSELKLGSKPEKKEALAFSAHEGSPSSDVLSIYVGKIYQRVYSKWKTPLGSKAKNVVVAFTIFPKGNIDKPVIRESAGDENLDSIAVRAIFDSVPFLPLPQELHRPNLRVSIIFKYVPEKN